MAGGAGQSVPGCQAAAAQMIEEHKAEFLDGTRPFPVCIDTALATGTSPEDTKI